jgi:hypothetical protein
MRARRDLWWFIEKYTDEDDETVMRAMDIQDKVLASALAALPVPASPQEP